MDNATLVGQRAMLVPARIAIYEIKYSRRNETACDRLDPPSKGMELPGRCEDAKGNKEFACIKS